MAWNDGNSLELSDTLNANSSWVVTFNENGTAKIINASTVAAENADDQRVIVFNLNNATAENASEKARFAAYSKYDAKESAPKQYGIPVIYKLTDEEKPEHTHTYGTPEYKWSDDKTTCTATAKCTGKDCTEVLTEAATATSEVTKAATCAEEGVTTYTATFENKAFETQTTTTPIAKTTEHPWDDGVVTTEPKCEEKGVKTFTCTVCKTTKTEDIPATGHNWGDDGKCTHEGCDATKPTTVSYVLSTTAPVAGDQFILCVKDGENYVALTCTDVNKASSAGTMLTVENGVVTSTTDNLVWVLEEGAYPEKDPKYTGLVMRAFATTDKYLHLNSSKIRVTTSAQNGIITFTETTNTGSYTLLADTGTPRYLSYSNGNFGVSDSAAAELYFFILAK